MACHPIPSNWPSFPPPEKKQDEVYRWIRDGDLDALKAHKKAKPIHYGEWPILHVTILLGQTDIFKYILDCPGVDVTSTTRDGLNVLHVACQQNQTDIILDIQERFCCYSYPAKDEEDLCDEECLDEYHFMVPDHHNYTPLDYIIPDDHIQAFEAVFDHWEDIPMTELYEFVIRCDAVRIFNYISGYFAHAAIELVECGSLRCLKSLVDKGKVEIPRDNVELLCRTIYKNNYHMFVYLYTHHINLTDTKNVMLIMKAIQNNAFLIFQYLVRNALPATNAHHELILQTIFEHNGDLETRQKMFWVTRENGIVPPDPSTIPRAFRKIRAC